MSDERQVRVRCAPVFQRSESNLQAPARNRKRMCLGQQLLCPIVNRKRQAVRRAVRARLFVSSPGRLCTTSCPVHDLSTACGQPPPTDTRLSSGELQRGARSRHHRSCARSTGPVRTRLASQYCKPPETEAVQPNLARASRSGPPPQPSLSAARSVRKTPWDTSRRFVS